MPHQDYVKTPRPTPRPKKGAAPAKKPKPYLLVGVVALLLVGFGYFLWHISHQPGANQLAAKQQQQTEQALANEAKKDELPPKPVKEPYTYIKSLENKEIVVQPEELVQKAPVTMYCGTFKSRDAAEELKAKIAFEGIAAEIRENDGKFRVVSGPYASKRMAQSDQNKLQRRKVARCWVS